MIKKLSFLFKGRELNIRETLEGDLPHVTSIINAAYKMWALKDSHIVCDSEEYREVFFRK